MWNYGKYYAVGPTGANTGLGEGTNVAIVHSSFAQNYNVALTKSARVVGMGSWTGYQANVPADFHKKWAIYNTTLPYALAIGPPRLGQTDPVLIDFPWIGTDRGSDFNSPIDPASVAAGRLSQSGHILVFQGEKFMLADLDIGTSGVRRSAIARSWTGGAPSGSRYFFRQESSENLPLIYTPTSAYGVWPNPATDYFALYAIMEDNTAPSFTIESLGNPLGQTPEEEPIQLGTINPTVAVTFSDADRVSGYDDYPTQVILSLYRWNGSTWVLENTHTHYAGGEYEIPSSGTEDVVIDLPAPSGIEYDETYRIHVNGRDELGELGVPYSNTAASWPAQLEFQVVSGGRLEDVSVS